MSLLKNWVGLFAEKPNRNQRRTESKVRPKLSLTLLEDRITPDAKVFTTSTLAVQVGATYTGANAILDAANNALTLDGYFVVVDTANAPLGGYTAGTINKDLTLWGSNHGIDPNTGARVPEVFINTSAGTMSGANGRALAIDGFSFVTAGGLGAFFTNTTNNYSLAFTNNIVKNQNAPNVNGLQLGVSGAPGIAAATISHNLFDGMTTGSAIRISTSTNAAITDNVILNGRSGIQIQASIPSVNGILINNNYISDMQLSAIRLEGNVNNPTVTNNTIINANLSNNAQHAGIRLATNFTGSGGTPGVTGTPTVKNNLITNSNTGIRFTDGTFVDIVATAISLNAIDVNPGTSAVATGNTADATIDLSGNWLGTASPAALEGVGTGTRSYVIQSYLSGNANSRTGATSTSSGVWGFSPNLATVEMLVPQTKATSLLNRVDGSIQSGIDRAASGQRVRVASDTFSGNVSALANAVTLIANGQVTINGNLAFNSDDTLGVEISGTNPATQYSNFIVNGTVNLGNASLAISLIGGYMVPPGTFPTFNIINNDGFDPVVGTFNSQAEGSTITSGGTTFTITYQGGLNSNDVVLIRNVAPTDIALNNSSIAENNPINAVIGNFSTTDPDVGDTFTYSLVPGAGSSGNGSFTINGSGQLLAAISFNFEAQSSYAVRVRSTDAGGLFTEQNFTIFVTNVNETPTQVNLSSNTLPENAGSNFVIGTLSTVDPDVGDTFTYTLVGSGNNNALFNISGNQLRANASFNFESQSTYTVRVRSTDAGGLFIARNFTIIVTNVNEAPTQVFLSNSSLPENAGANYVIGTLSTTDADTTPQTFTYTLVGSGNDNALFNISGNQLRANASFDFETQSVYTVRIRSTDQGGLFIARNFTIIVTDVAEGPSFWTAPQSGGPVKQYVVTSLGAPAVPTGLSINVTGAAKIAYADVNGDGTEDIVVATVSANNSFVTVYNGKNAAFINSFTPFASGTTSAIYVAAGDVNADGKADVVVSNGSVGTGANSNTRVYDGAYIASGKAVVSPLVGGTQAAQGRIRDFFAFTNATGSSAGNGNSFTPNTGATVAVGDFNGDGRADIVVGVAGGGTSRVNIFDSKVLLGTNSATAWPKPNVDLNVYNLNWSTGVTVAAGDINGDGRADLITGALSGGPNIRVFTFAAGSTSVPVSAHAAFTNASGTIITTTYSGTAPTLAADFFVGIANNVGVRVAARDLNKDGFAEILYTFGANQPAFASTHIGTIDGKGLTVAFTPTPYQLQFAPPPGTDYTLVVAAYPGAANGAWIA